MLKLNQLRSARLRWRAGFTLLEIMIVITIIGLLVAIAGVALQRTLDSAKQDTARTEMQSLKSALDLMQLEIGRYPTQQEGLALLNAAPGDGAPGWNGPYLDRELPDDPWNNPYVYVAPQGDTAPTLMSLGKDGQEGGTGFGEDIVLQPFGA